MGVSVILAESVIGAFLDCPPGEGAFGSEINVSHLRPKRAGGRLTVVGARRQKKSGGGGKDRG